MFLKTRKKNSLSLFQGNKKSLILLDPLGFHCHCSLWAYLGVFTVPWGWKTPGWKQYLSKYPNGHKCAWFSKFSAMVNLSIVNLMRSSITWERVLWAWGRLSLWDYLSWEDPFTGGDAQSLVPTSGRQNRHTFLVTFVTSTGKAAKGYN